MKNKPEPGVLLGYFYILLAATLWGSSAVMAKVMFKGGEANAVLMSQARVSFSWLILLVVLPLFNRKALRVPIRDLWQFALLGFISIAGANFLLYYAFQIGMDVAVADLIQFTAPALVALWLWLRKQEPMDRPKAIALGLSLVGCALALGVLSKGLANVNAVGLASAFASALCYAFLLVYGKHLTRRYPLPTYLFYALMGAFIFWAVINPPWIFIGQIKSVKMGWMLFFFAIISVLLPYLFFFLGLQRVPASRAGIVSTWEPVWITIAGWIVLGERLAMSQLLGVGLVLGAIVLIELFPSSDKHTA